MSESVQLFNPVFLSEISDTEIVTKLHLLADKLTYFEYPQFNHNFIKGLKKEMPDVVKKAKRNCDLDAIDASKQFKTRMQKRMKKGVDNDQDLGVVENQDENISCSCIGNKTSSINTTIKLLSRKDFF